MQNITKYYSFLSYTNTQSHAHLHTNIHSHIHIHTFTHTHTHSHTHTYMHTHTHKSSKPVATAECHRCSRQSPLLLRVSCFVPGNSHYPHHSAACHQTEAEGPGNCWNDEARGGRETFGGSRVARQRRHVDVWRLVEVGGR